MFFKYIFSLTILVVVLGFPALEISHGDIEKCHDLTCPKGTSICERNSTTLTTPNVIRTTITCKDINGNVLNSSNSDQANLRKGYTSNIYTFRLSYSKTQKQIENFAH